LLAVGLHTCTAVARSLCVSWAFLSYLFAGRFLAMPALRFLVDVIKYLKFLIIIQTGGYLAYIAAD